MLTGESLHEEGSGGAAAAGKEGEGGEYDGIGFNQDSSFAMESLLRAAGARLKPETGRLVFWLPTDANLTSSDVRDILRHHERKAGIYGGTDGMMESDGSSSRSSLVFQRARQQEINSGVWRWLCVYSKQ